MYICVMRPKQTVQEYFILNLPRNPMTNAIQALQHTSRVLNISSLNARLAALNTEAETLDKSDDFVVCQLDATRVGDALA
jgi:hypothetical protein